MKYSGCCNTHFVITLYSLWYNSAATRVEKENKHRTFVFKNVITGIENYYQNNQKYPPHVSELSLQNQNIVDDFITAGVFEYNRDPSEIEWYSLTCRFSGILTSGSGRYRLALSGIQYSNKKEKLPLSPGANVTLDQNGSYFADFH